MSRPGITTTLRDTPPPRSAPTDTGVWFAVGLADKGLTSKAVLITSLSQFVQKFGTRQSYSILYDAVETFFREGGGKVYISRVVGPGATKATVNLLDSAAAVSLTATAKSPGAWGAALNVAVLAGDAAGEFKIQVSHDTDGILETSPSLVDQAAAVSWAANSDYIDLALGASALDPATVAATSLAGGGDDRNNVTDAEWLAALNRFVKDLGPGQVSAPGRTTAVSHGQLLDHALANNRIALCDAPDSASKSTLLTAASAFRTAVNRRYGGLFAPWANVPGVVPGTTRDVPYSAVQAGLIARSDGLGNTPNVAAAGENGIARFALDVKASFTDADRKELNEAGVNLARLLYGQVRTYGYRTGTNPTSDPNWLNLGNVRLFMAIVAKGEVVAERFIFDQIDGRFRKINEFKGALIGEVTLPYYEAGSLFGETPEEAFNVDTGPQVNTPETIANQELRAAIAVRMSPMAEEVILEITKVATQEAVA